MGAQDLSERGSDRWLLRIDRRRSLEVDLSARSLAERRRGEAGAEPREPTSELAYDRLVEAGLALGVLPRLQINRPLVATRVRIPGVEIRGGAEVAERSGRV